MNNTFSKIILSCLMGASMHARTPAKVHNLPTKGKPVTLAKQKPGQPDLTGAKPSTDFGFRMNAFGGYIKDSSIAKNFIHDQKQKTLVLGTQDHKFLSAIPNIALMAEVNHDLYRGRVHFEHAFSQHKHTEVQQNIDGIDNLDNWPMDNAITMKNFVDTYINFGREGKLNVDIGLVDGAEAWVFPSNSTFYRGPDRGIFGHAAKLAKANTAILRGKKSTDGQSEDSTNLSYPVNTLWFKDDIAGSKSDEVKVTVWLPQLKSGKHCLEVGLSSTLTTETDHGIYLSAGASYDYHMQANRKIRLAIGGGAALGKEEKNNLKQAKGVAAGLSYHSTRFDLGVKGTYNFNSYTILKNIAPVDVYTEDKKGAALGKENYSYVAKDAKAPMAFSAKARLALWSDCDLTLGGIYSHRTTGMKKNKDKLVANMYGASVGINGPICGTPFRWGAELNWFKMDNKAHKAEVNYIDNSVTFSQFDQAFIVGLGITYAPTKHN